MEAAIATAQRSKDPVKEVSQATPKVLQGMFFGLWPAFLADPRLSAVHVQLSAVQETAFEEGKR